MSQPKTATLDEAMAALQRLPEDTQMALAEELVALAEDYQTPSLTDAQRDIVARRLAEPLWASSFVSTESARVPAQSPRAR